MLLFPFSLIQYGPRIPEPRGSFLKVDFFRIIRSFDFGLLNPLGPASELSRGKGTSAAVTAASPRPSSFAFFLFRTRFVSEAQDCLKNHPPLLNDEPRLETIGWASPEAKVSQWVLITLDRSIVPLSNARRAE